MRIDIEATTGLATAAAVANTAPPVWGEERLAELDQLEVFLGDHGLESTRPLRAADLEQAHALRTVLRWVFTATDERAVVDALNTLVADTDVRAQLVADDGRSWRWCLAASPGATAVTRLAALTAASLLTLVRDDGLARLHVCAADGCVGVFADTTRNRSRRYCTPELCGNRTNLAAYRARRRLERESSPESSR